MGSNGESEDKSETAEDHAGPKIIRQVANAYTPKNASHQRTADAEQERNGDHRPLERFGLRRPATEKDRLEPIIIPRDQICRGEGHQDRDEPRSCETNR